MLSNGDSLSWYKWSGKELYPWLNYFMCVAFTWWNYVPGTRFLVVFNFCSCSKHRRKSCNSFSWFKWSGKKLYWKKCDWSLCLWDFYSLRYCCYMCLFCVVSEHLRKVFGAALGIFGASSSNLRSGSRNLRSEYQQLGVVLGIVGAARNSSRNRRSVSEQL